LWVAVLAFLAVRLAPQFSALTGLRLPGAHPAEGSTPTFAVTTLEGDTLRSDDLRGRVVIVNFWATWCPPCRIEVPSLQSLWEVRRDDGVVVLGLSMDRGGRAAVDAFLRERGVTYPVAMADRAVESAFGGVPGLPTTFILDADGTVRHRVYGYFAPPAMRAAVARILSEEDGGDAPTDPPISGGTAADPS
jgi:peroxiredoxin